MRFQGITLTGQIDWLGLFCVVTKISGGTIVANWSHLMGMMRFTGDGFGRKKAHDI